MAKVDWRQKYFELRSKYLNGLDVAYKMGVQEGMRQSELEQMQMQLQQAQQQAMAAQQQMAMAQAGAPEEGGEVPPEEGGQMPPEGGEEMPPEMMEEGAEGEEAGGDELDASIDELEGLVAKSESGDIDPAELLKAIHKMKESKEQVDSKKVLVKQRNIVDGIMKKWKEEETKATSDISKLIEGFEND